MPMPSIFLTAEWQNLAIANYEMDPAILLPYLPPKTEIDYFNNKCLVSLVAFRFVNTRLKGVPVPFHQNFEEINLRFYVKHKSGNEWRRGVSFIKEIVPRPALTFVANSIFREKYMTLPTRHKILINYTGFDIRYEWKHQREWDHFHISTNGVPLPWDVGSREEFITEHYWGYTRLSNTLSAEYQVEHSPWKMYRVDNFELNVRFRELYGADFAFLDDAIPSSVMLAEGSRISVRSAVRIK
jgi:uncharacterized protein YqjF (DUF2071 family)